MQLNSNFDGKLILHCGGGLGNQMFEYAAGLYFAAQLKKQLEIVRPLPQHAQWAGFPRPFQLNQFAIRSKVRETEFVDRIFFSTNSRLRSAQFLLSRFLRAELMREPVIYRFHPDLADKATQKNIYANGSWQAADYVVAVESSLRKEYQFKAPPQGKTQAYLDQILRMKCPISIHLRIGDYALINHSVNSSAPVSMVLKNSYYTKAIKLVTELFPVHTLVVFSDDQEAAKKILPPQKDYLFIEGNDAMSAYEDLRLMSHCRHHIIANSSFSWWGAWLNPDPEKKVFAPQYWANTEDSYFPDLYPSGWTILDNLDNPKAR